MTRTVHTHLSLTDTACGHVPGLGSEVHTMIERDSDAHCPDTSGTQPSLDSMNSSV